jgi:hypothetical protein
MGRAFWYRGLPCRALHVVVSYRIQEDGWNESDYKVKTRAILKRHGATGGMMVRHTMRKGDEEERQPDGCVHYHCLCLVPGQFLPGGLPEDGPVVVKVIEDAVSGGFKGVKKKKQLANLVKYLLTHASVREHEQSITYFGLLAPNMMSQKTLATEFPEAIEHMEERERQRCPCCDSPWIHVQRGVMRSLHEVVGSLPLQEWRSFAKRHPRPLEALLLLQVERSERRAPPSA